MTTHAEVTLKITKKQNTVTVKETPNNIDTSRVETDRHKGIIGSHNKATYISHILQKRVYELAKEIREKNDKIQHVFLDEDCTLVIRTDTMLDKAPTPMSSNVLETMDKDHKFETYLRAVGRSIQVKESDVWVQQVKKK